jgi:hypothetical protein
MLSFKNQQPYKAIPPTHFILKCKVLYSPLSYVPFTFHNLKWYYGIGRATLGATHHALDPPEFSLKSTFGFNDFPREFCNGKFPGGTPTILSNRPLGTESTSKIV